MKKCFVCGKDAEVEEKIRADNELWYEVKCGRCENYSLKYLNIDKEIWNREDAFILSGVLRRRSALGLSTDITGENLADLIQSG